MSISIDQKAIKQLGRLPDNGRKVIQMTLQRSALEVMNEGKKNAPYITGNLRRSITMDPQKVGIGDKQVKVGSNLVYARIQDEGGTITPKRGKYLAFRTRDGQFVLARRVFIRGNKYLTNAYENMRTRINKIFNEEFNKNIFAK